jgi:hypothetical protein
MLDEEDFLEFQEVEKKILEDESVRSIEHFNDLIKFVVSKNAHQFSEKDNLERFFNVTQEQLQHFRENFPKPFKSDDYRYENLENLSSHNLLVCMENSVNFSRLCDMFNNVETDDNLDELTDLFYKEGVFEKVFAYPPSFFNNMTVILELIEGIFFKNYDYCTSNDLVVDDYSRNGYKDFYLYFIDLPNLFPKISIQSIRVLNLVVIMPGYEVSKLVDAARAVGEFFEKSELLKRIANNDHEDTIYKIWKVFERIGKEDLQLGESVLDFSSKMSDLLVELSEREIDMLLKIKGENFERILKLIEENPNFIEKDLKKTQRIKLFELYQRDFKNAKDLAEIANETLLSFFGDEKVDNIKFSQVTNIDAVIFKEKSAPENEYKFLTTGDTFHNLKDDYQNVLNIVENLLKAKSVDLSVELMMTMGCVLMIKEDPISVEFFQNMK